MRNAILHGKKISKVYANGQGKNTVLNEIDVNIYKEDFTIIMGTSGSGKSTLLYTLSGMDLPTSGDVEYKGKNLCSISEKEMARLRAREFGFVFQQSHLVSNLTLLENVLVAGYVSHREKKSEIRKRAETMLQDMGIWEAKDRLPSETSGGEMQRAAIARAVISSPDLIWCDEPTGALNKSNTEDILNLLSDINKKGQSILMVTHDLRAAIRGNRILYLEDGKIIDELILTPYREAEEKQRERRISKWLSELQW